MGATRSTGAGRPSARPARGGDVRRGRGALCALVLSVAAATTVAGCGGGPSAARPVGPLYEVSAAPVADLGTVLVDGKGDTLYLFLPDDHSSHSRCARICAAAWPPLVLPPGVPSPRAGQGVRTSLLGTTLRTDGTRQVTYNGWPLYRYEADAGPGQATGQGLNNLGGLWYVVSPQGEPVRS